MSKYIQYDELLSYMSREKLDSLPTIDIESTIDEMIEEYNKVKTYYDHEEDAKNGSISALQELKSRLLK